MYYVYIHTLPNGKVYIGETRDVVRRWNNGEGYSNNAPFYNAIQRYGWQNIKHEIIGEFDDETDAKICEAVLTTVFDSEKENVGYNKTDMKAKALELYSKRKMVEWVQFEKPNANKNIFENSVLPISACEEMINQWIFNKKNREILHDRLIDGMTYSELKEKYEISVRQLKNIVYDCSKILSEHL